MQSRVEHRISIINKELPEDSFTMQIISEHDAERFLWKIWLSLAFLVFFLLVI